MPRRFLHRTHLLNPGRQYSTKYSSVYSTPWPLPNLPCVLVDVNKRGVCRFTSKYSLPSLVTIFFGHQAPPPLSCRSLINEGIMPRVSTHPLAKGTSQNNMYKIRCEERVHGIDAAYIYTRYVFFNNAYDDCNAIAFQEEERTGQYNRYSSKRDRASLIIVNLSWGWI